jgi:hypothetical protein
MCNEEVDRLQEGLRAFRRSAHNLAEQLDTPGKYTIPGTSAVPHRAWRWAAAAAMATTFALLPLFMDNTPAVREVDAADDALVLSRVRARLSQSVPQPMQQLMNLMNSEEDPQ